MGIRPLQPPDREEWLRMRRAMWPDWPDPMQIAEMEETLGLPDLRTVLVWERLQQDLGGFIEVHIRKRVNNAASPLVAYVEGWFVDPDLRRQGIGRQLIEAAATWALQQGLTEMASDTELSNEISRQAHQQLGFKESYRLVHYLKDLT